MIKTQESSVLHKSPLQPIPFHREMYLEKLESRIDRQLPPHKCLLLLAHLLQGQCQVMVGVHVLWVFVDQVHEDGSSTFGVCVYPINAFLQPVVNPFVDSW